MYMFIQVGAFSPPGDGGTLFTDREHAEWTLENYFLWL
jgi:hypothetical protein